MSQRRVVQWIWVGNAFGVLLAVVILLVIATRESTTGTSSSSEYESPPQQSQTQQCVESARQIEERAVDAGLDPTVIWTKYQIDQIGSLGDPELMAYQSGVGAVSFQAMFSSDGDELWEAFVNGVDPGSGQEMPGAYAKCAEFYGP